MSKMNEIIKAYADERISLEDANKQLEAIGSTIRIDPDKNVISAQEMAATVVDDDPAKVSGWGLMYHGIGKPEKMRVQNGKFEYDTGYEKDQGIVLKILDRKYRIIGDHIEVM